MSEAQRIAFGHALVNVGLSVRRLSARVAMIVGLVVVAATVIGRPGDGGFLEPFALLRAGARTADIATVGWQAVAIAVAVVLAARALAILAGAAGWCVFPRTHRALLNRIVTPR